ncbi:hypothetical protein [Zhongshania sp.]|uniref:hypothetical protein n=1 Tax=Zhongshania sp. TaxID=1971902 RepID=UPI003566397A
MNKDEIGVNKNESAPSWTRRSNWKMPLTESNETCVAGFGSAFPARALITFQALGLGCHELAFDSPHGRRSVSRCFGGSFKGERLAGLIAEDVSNEWRLYAGAGDDQFSVEGLITLLADGGETILMKYIGRGGGRYGAGSYRIGAVFEAPVASPLAWLNSVSAAGYVEIDGDSLRADLFELLGQASDDATAVEVEPLYQMTGLDSVGDRLTIHGAVSNRYFTMAETGCLAEGALEGMWVKGLSWGPHRMSSSASSLPWQIDMKVMMQTKQGVPVLQQYLGTIPDRTAPGIAPNDPSWRTAAVFETDVNSEQSWLNEVVAVGVGWKEDNEAHYHYYILV